MGNNEIPCYAPSAYPSANPIIPHSTDFSIALSIFPGYFQYLTSSSQTKSLPSGAPFLCSSTKSNILPSTNPLPDPSMLSIKDWTYFLSDETNSTPTSTLSRYTSIFPIVQSIMSSIHTLSSLTIIDSMHLPKSHPVLLLSYVPPDLPRFRTLSLRIFDPNNIMISLPILFPYNVIPYPTMLSHD